MLSYTVKAVADLAGVSVRTLHHYDQIGVLKPASVSASGYRLYTEPDLERLQQILFFRELGFSLREIKAIIDSPSFDRKQAMIAHKEILLEKKQRLERLIESVDLTINAMERGTPMDKGAMFEGFDDAKIEEYKEKYREEAEAKYAKEIVDESYRRVANYTTEDWNAIGAESHEINQILASLMDRDPADAEVQEQVGRWFRVINGNFYHCTPEIFRGLGDLYVEDSRFTAHYDEVRPGLAAFMRSAMHVYADRLSVGG
jgi:MerR family transcriptional regulator, multidrug-efflux activator